MLPSKFHGFLPYFEDLEPHRFEDLVRQLIYDFSDWQNIAARLYLPVNTLRARIANNYQKLGVRNHVRAAARARELGLLPGE